MRANNIWRARHPLKAAAWAKVRLAKLRGDLVPKPCEVCGTTEGIHAHHDDYTQPLEVRWLCKPHHDEWHKTNTPIE